MVVPTWLTAVTVPLLAAKLPMPTGPTMASLKVTTKTTSWLLTCAGVLSETVSTLGGVASLAFAATAAMPAKPPAMRRPATCETAAPLAAAAPAAGMAVPVWAPTPGAGSLLTSTWASRVSLRQPSCPCAVSPLRSGSWPTGVSSAAPASRAGKVPRSVGVLCAAVSASTAPASSDLEPAGSESADSSARRLIRQVSGSAGSARCGLGVPGGLLCRPVTAVSPTGLPDGGWAACPSGSPWACRDVGVLDFLVMSGRDGTVGRWPADRTVPPPAA